MADLDTLQSLPRRELVAGLAEVIKYGPIADEVFLDWIESHLEALLARDRAALAHAVRRSCEIKARIVGLDERESGVRAHLNFGHTFGHAIETGLGHGEWLHGEAVGCGMVMAVDLSARLGLVPRAYAERLTRLIQAAGLPIAGPALGAERYLALMRHDKKSEGGEIRFVVIEAPGRAGGARGPLTRSSPRSSKRTAPERVARPRRAPEPQRMLQAFACHPSQSRGRRHAEAAATDRGRVPA